MFLYEVFPPELTIMKLESRNKDEVFEELVDRFCETEKIKKNVNILEALWERESKMSSGIMKGVAIPHAKTPAVGTIRGILGISKKGIDYDALDGQPVNILFMLLAPPSDSDAYLELLRRLAEILDNRQFTRDILLQHDPAGINGVIKKYEENLLTQPA